MGMDEKLEKDLIEYAISRFSDKNGLGIAVNDTDTHTIDLLSSYGFVKSDNTENVLELDFENYDFDYLPPQGIEIKSLNPENDLYKYHKVLWMGFNHDGDAPIDETTIAERKRMLSAPHMHSYLHIAAENKEGDYAAYCGCWYNPNTDYCYVEPVCTIPQFRKLGLGRAVLLEALKRCSSLGSKKAYVISNDHFYKSLGFCQHSHFTFYWYRR